MNKKILFAIFLIGTILFLTINYGHLLTLENAKSQQESLSNIIESNFVIAALSYFVIYIVVVAFSIPGAAVVTLLGAALFGFWTSLVLVSFASSIGATLAFLSSRFLLKEWVQKKFGSKLSTINEGVEKDGAFYLFSLRLIPVVPFFLINLLMGLTPISALRFYLVSQLGMLPGTAVYLNAGTQLANIESLSGIVSLPVILSFVLLGLFPIITKKAMTIIRKSDSAKQNEG
ncbi:TVP38/TMEM64 family protein [Vibrio genomosp. F10]|uniref:TVP38/TMEM64 family membrane protein n=2 Tax=Vibrio genomosp. F10 TaxID=723171 RepID=A0A1B9QVY9_9VIBR|nr:TVP38/TMEM64 family protein [Vibrio genomosp. F10]OCH73462.1 dihydrolipoamide dehydrogenase [Vibrio genomosp. F10]OEE36564.1 dihydrolipoamide dehydrogenase [Vibrio genomosp. F10 str. ZF-129]OEE82628.1 dihydrolipoamide dehydrogenase [Vibrio genomosp. F10 str. 9ZD137]OEE93159.1 dihydrolipoamide dehydrogenase [Vibrio genomosp. F10 str. 9ZC157]OEF10409.1 dihydrolipoamide dehydrogenase [Vibrio genomosp. F10 str. 9ZB36]